MSLPIAEADRLAIVLIDVQPYFLDAMHGDPEPLLVRLEQLLLVAEWFDLPVLATLEEPTDRKGRLPDRLQQLFPATGRTVHKQTYDLSREPEIEPLLEDLERTQFAVAGGETDVCVLQSVLGLRRRGGDVFLLEDCLYSSESHVESALRRMESAGAVPLTYKALFYELSITDDPDRWKEQRRRAESRGFVPVETLPPRGGSTDKS